MKNRYKVYFDFKSDIVKDVKYLQFTLISNNDYVAFTRINNILDTRFRINICNYNIKNIYIYKDKNLIYKGGLL